MFCCSFGRSPGQNKNASVAATRWLSLCKGNAAHTPAPYGTRVAFCPTGWSDRLERSRSMNLYMRTQTRSVCLYCWPHYLTHWFDYVLKLSDFILHHCLAYYHLVVFSLYHLDLYTSERHFIILCSLVYVFVVLHLPFNNIYLSLLLYLCYSYDSSHGQ